MIQCPYLFINHKSIDACNDLCPYLLEDEQRFKLGGADTCISYHHFCPYTSTFYMFSQCYMNVFTCFRMFLGTFLQSPCFWYLISGCQKTPIFMFLMPQELQVSKWAENWTASVFLREKDRGHKNHQRGATDQKKGEGARPDAKAAPPPPSGDPEAHSPGVFNGGLRRSRKPSALILFPRNGAARAAKLQNPSGRGLRLLLRSSGEGGNHPHHRLLRSLAWEEASTSPPSSPSAAPPSPSPLFTSSPSLFEYCFIIATCIVLRFMLEIGYLSYFSGGSYISENVVSHMHSSMIMFHRCE